MADETSRFRAFIDGFRSVVIGSIDEQGSAFSSYAPFVLYEETYYLFLSDIARHAANLRRTGNASLLFIEDESTCSNIFARKRIVLQCEVTLIPREEKAFPEAMRMFEQKFDASMMAMLLGMQDFNLYALRPLSGEATFGFGEAYKVGGEKMQSLLPRQGGNGHK